MFHFLKQAIKAPLSNCIYPRPTDCLSLKLAIDRLTNIFFLNMKC